MQEYVDFLKKYAPYDRLSDEELLVLARHVEVEFFSSGAVIIEAQKERLDRLYIVRTGAVHLLDRGRVVDELEPGETFGQISVFSELPPPLSVVASRDTICYRIPDPRDVIDHAERLTFAHYNTIVSRSHSDDIGFDQSFRLVREFMREPIFCDADTRIREAAQLMTERSQSCVVIEDRQGIGIMTDSDCRRLLTHGDVDVDAPISAIVTRPARTIESTATVSSAFFEMVTHGVHHLVVVNHAGRVVGTNRVIDLLSVEFRDPLLIRAAIDRASTYEELQDASALLKPSIVELYDAGVPPLRAAGLISVMVDALVEKCVSFEPMLAEDCHEVHTSWLVLGSTARREPLPLSDIDSALAWTSPASAHDAELRTRLIAAADGVIQRVEGCGRYRCDDGANANNPLFNRTSVDWLNAAQRWIKAPTAEGALLLTSMVTDSRPLTGRALGQDLMDSIDKLSTNKLFVKLMLDEALAIRPPTGFVRDFVVQSDGQHKGQLSLKRGGLTPLAAIGRWVAVTTRMPVLTTQERLREGVRANLLTEDEGATLQAAHREIFGLLFAREVDAIRTGVTATRYIDPSSLDTLTRRHLRESFRAVARVQSRLESEWTSRIR